MHEKDKLKDALKERYGSIAEGKSSGCCSSSSVSCCGDTDDTALLKNIGYDSDDLPDDFAEANLGLGCGNPKAIASLQAGETVLDLGCGAGFDLFLAGRQVGEEGRLIGIDLTPEMIAKAKKNAEKNEIDNIEFHLADIEDLPLEDDTVDVIISNCVINLTSDKRAVYQEARRVLKPGGRLAIADILKKQELPQELEEDISSYTECVGGAIKEDELQEILTDLNYTNIEIKEKENSSDVVQSWSEEYDLPRYIFSAYITAEKPV